jgi:hypothetical protein
MLNNVTPKPTSTSPASLDNDKADNAQKSHGSQGMAGGHTVQVVSAPLNIEQSAVIKTLNDGMEEGNNLEKDLFHKTPGIVLTSSDFSNLSNHSPGANVPFAPIDNLNQLLGILSPSCAGGLKQSQTLRPSNYFHQVQVLNENKEVITSIHHEWAINFRVLLTFSDAVRKGDPRAAQILLERAFSYLCTFSLIGNAEKLGWQSSPTQQMGKKTQSSYHRDGSALIEVYTKALNDRRPIAQNGGHKITLFPVSDIGVVDAFKRRFSLSSKGIKPEFLDPSTDPDGLKGIATALSDDCFADNVSTHVFVDISERISQKRNENTQFAELPLEAQIAAITDEVLNELEENIQAAGLKSGRQLADLMEEARSYIVFGGTMMIGNQPVLFTQENPNIPEQESDHESLLHSSGFVPAPAQIFANWTTFATPQEILDALRSIKAPVSVEIALPDKTDGLQKFPTYQSFLDRVWNLLGWMVSHSKPPHAGERANNPTVFCWGQYTLQLLATLQRELGFETLNRQGTDPDTGAVIQYLYNRILSHVEDSATHSNDMPAFINHMQLAHAEILTLLTLLAPYRLDKLDLRMTSADRPGAHFQLVNGGMHALSTILGAVETELGHPDVRAVYLKGTYFEHSQSILNKAPRYQVGILDSEKIQESIEKIRQKLGKGKADLLLLEFDHNISVENSTYKKENLSTLITVLRNGNILNNKVTIAIDTTTALQHAPEITSLFERHQNSIKNGSFNIIFFRSCQKFDMGGFDDKNGGLVEMHNNQQDWDSFNAKCAATSYNPPETVMHGLLHALYNGDLDRYRKEIMEAHGMFFGHIPSAANLPPELIADKQQANGDDILIIAANESKEAVFLDVHSPLGVPYKAMVVLFKNLAKHVEVMYSGRGSFGFAHLNLATIAGTKFRITLGTEKEATLIKIKKIILTIREVGAEALTAAGGDKNRVKKLFDTTARMNALLCATYDMNHSRQFPMYSVQFSTGHDGRLMAKIGDPRVSGGSKHYIAYANAWEAAGFGEAAAAILEALSRYPFNTSQINHKNFSSARLAAAQHILMRDDRNPATLNLAEQLLNALKKPPSIISKDDLAECFLNFAGQLCLSNPKDGPSILKAESIFNEYAKAGANSKKIMDAAWGTGIHLIRAISQLDPNQAAIFLEDLLHTHKDSIDHEGKKKEIIGLRMDIARLANAQHLESSMTYLDRFSHAVFNAGSDFSEYLSTIVSLAKNHGIEKMAMTVQAICERPYKPAAKQRFFYDFIESAMREKNLDQTTVTILENIGKTILISKRSYDELSKIMKKDASAFPMGAMVLERIKYFETNNSSSSESFESEEDIDDDNDDYNSDMSE